jgi:hypothetical protein
VLSTARINTLVLLLVLIVGIAILAMLASGARGGPLDPPGPPSPSGTLPQVEPRSPVPPVGWDGTFPITIAASGSYFLTRNLSTPTGAVGVNITASYVTLDLNGFTLDGNTEGSGTGVGVRAEPSTRQVHVSNGKITEFRTAVELPGQRSSVSELTTELSTSVAIFVGQEAVVEDCRLTYSQGRGIVAGGVSLIRGCLIGGTGDGANVGASSVVEDNFIIGGRFAGEYGVRANGADITIRGNVLENGVRDIGVAGHGAVIIDNVIHCVTSIVNLGAFSYWAPVSGEAHSNQPRYAAGFC